MLIRPASTSRFLRVALPAILLASACSGDSTGSQAGLRGTWTLQSVNGHALPVQWAPDRDLTGGTLAFPNDSEAVSVNAWHAPGAEKPDFTQQVRGRYTRTGSSVEIQLGGNRFGDYTGTVSGRTLRLRLGPGDDAQEWIYRR